MEVVNGQIMVSIDWIPFWLAAVLWIGMVALLVMVGIGRGE